MRNYTVVTCHFGDRFWIAHCLEAVDALSDSRVVEVVIVDQSRESAAFLQTLPRVGRVLDFPLDEEHIQSVGHDHAASLNRALRQCTFSTTHVIVLDSDCFPVKKNWLDELPEVCAAGDPMKWGLTHPCFVAIPVGLAARLDFSEGLLEVGIDTGRLIGLQIARLGTPIEIDAPVAAFRGTRGHFYFDESVYHHGSASFLSADDPRIRNKVNAAREAFYRNRILRGSFSISWLEYVLMRALRWVRARILR